MTGPLRITGSLAIAPAELSWRFSRSSGPGGQGVNTSDSRVELTFDVARSAALSDVQRRRLLQRLAGRLVDGTLTVTASEHRSQLRNRDAATARLTRTLREALAPEPAARRPTRPTWGSRQRRMDDKSRRGRTKQLRRRPPD